MEDYAYIKEDTVHKCQKKSKKIHNLSLDTQDG